VSKKGEEEQISEHRVGLAQHGKDLRVGGKNRREMKYIPNMTIGKCPADNMAQPTNG
jgi:hypothetical protein